MTETTIPPKSFYNGETKRKYLQLLQQKRKSKTDISKTPVKNQSVTSSYKSCFSEQSIWKYFHRQQNAIDYMHTVKHINLSLFAIEKENAKRKFLVTTQKQFWNMYKDMDKKQRHYYEVIREGTPCRMYFDIEFLYEFNKNINPLEVLETFIQFISYCLYTEYNLRTCRKDFVDLDSSTDKKFSRHLIIHLNNDDLIFENNFHVGDFLKEIVASLELYVLLNQTSRYLPVVETYLGDRDKLTKEKLKDMYVKTESGNCTWIFDQSVYSKNRNFRLYLSSKFSKNAHLQIAQENQFDFKRELTKLEKQIYKIRNLKFDQSFQLFQDTLVSPTFDIRKSKTVLRFTDHGEAAVLSSQSSAIHNRKLNNKKCSVKGSKKSDYPALDAFVLSHVNRKGSNQGWIRRWLCYDTSQLMIYDIDGNRYCGNIKREHKSNHIYYIADLKLNILYQKCFDPDCWNYRSPEVELPDEVNPFFISDFNELNKENENIKNTSKDSNTSNDNLDNLEDIEIDEIFGEDFDFDETEKVSSNASDFDLSLMSTRTVSSEDHSKDTTIFNAENDLELDFNSSSPLSNYFTHTMPGSEINLFDFTNISKINIESSNQNTSDSEKNQVSKNFLLFNHAANEPEKKAAISAMVAEKNQNPILPDADLTELEIEELFNDDINLI